ncbi:MAG: serine hydrolase domain-containing protein [Thermoplasmatota archaeon]
MKDDPKAAILDEIVSKVTNKNGIYGAVFNVSSDKKDINLISASGDFEKDSKYYIASINKFFLSAIILILYKEEKLALDDKILKFFPDGMIENLHVYKGKDHSSDITISHLISHTSGLPCFLTDKNANGKKGMDDLEAGIDQAWPTEKVIQEVKRMKSHFPPGKKGRAKYSDTNFQLLNSIIENVTGDPVNIVLKDLFKELNLTDTYVYEDVNDREFVPIRYKSKKIHLPHFLTSTLSDSSTPRGTSSEIRFGIVESKLSSSCLV